MRHNLQVFRILITKCYKIIRCHQYPKTSIKTISIFSKPGKYNKVACLGEETAEVIIKVIPWNSGDPDFTATADLTVSRLTPESLSVWY